MVPDTVKVAWLAQADVAADGVTGASAVTAAFPPAIACPLAPVFRVAGALVAMIDEPAVADVGEVPGADPAPTPDAAGAAPGPKCPDSASALPATPRTTSTATAAIPA